MYTGGGTISSIESRLSMNEENEEQGNSSMYLSARHPLPQRRSPDGREFRECDTELVNMNQCDGEQVCTAMNIITLDFNMKRLKILKIAVDSTDFYSTTQ